MHDPAIPAPSSSPADAPAPPWQATTLDVGDGHALYVEQCGARDAPVVLMLHGGPGGGFGPAHRQLLDPDRYRMVLFDQRGCGRSRPRGATTCNDTARSVGDIERIREHLGIARWFVFGGSWGASLAIAYGAAHPERCAGFVLRGAFLTGDDDLDWFFGGAGALLPDAWRALQAALGADPGASPTEPGAGLRTLDALASAMLDRDAGAALAAAAAWDRWETAVSSPGRTPGSGSAGPAATADAGGRPALVDRYRVQAHFLRRRCDLGEAALLAAARRLPAVPVALAHGRLDWVCRPVNAQRLADAISGATLRWVEQAGHSPFEAAMRAAQSALLATVVAQAGDAR